MSRYLADTTVLVEHLRGNPKARQFLETEDPYISSITKAELIQGTKDKTDLRMVLRVCKDLSEIFLTEKMTSVALRLLEKFHHSHGLILLDAFIAASTIENKLILITDNIKHYSFIKSLKIKDWKEIEKRV